MVRKPSENGQEKKGGLLFGKGRAREKMGVEESECLRPKSKNKRAE